MTTPDNETQEPKAGKCRLCGASIVAYFAFCGDCVNAERAKVEATAITPTPTPPTDAQGTPETDAYREQRRRVPMALCYDEHDYPNYLHVHFARSLETRLRQSSAELEKVKAALRKESRSKNVAVNKWVKRLTETESALTAERAARTQAEQERDALKLKVAEAVVKINKIAWGYDGDCGATSIIESILP